MPSECAGSTPGSGHARTGQKPNTIKVLSATLIAIALCIGVGPPLPEGVTPESGFASIGNSSIGYVPGATTYTLQNGVETSVQWTAVGAQPWLTIAPSSGVLGPGATVDITILINPAANGLPPGDYKDSISFNWTVLRGDMNGDTRVSTADVALFAAVATGQNTDTNLFRVADMNEDGSVDGRDGAEFTAAILGN